MARRGAERDKLKLENWEAYVKKVNYSIPYELERANSIDRFIAFETESEGIFNASLARVLEAIKSE